MQGAALDRRVEHQDDIGSDDVADIKAMREAAREHSGAFVVNSDLENEDEREAAPGTREQE